MSQNDRDDETTKTLDDEEIVSERGRAVGRRKALHLAGGAAAFGAVALATGCGRRRTVVVQQAAITDQDGGPCADPVNGGRGNSGLTDQDAGQCADPVGRGRTGNQVVQPQQPYTGITDSDGGQYADPAGYGRGGGGASGITDSDGGAYADPAGNGRGRSGCTDSDGGAYADPAGRGRC